jgi:hypothetical protein
VIKLQAKIPMNIEFGDGKTEHGPGVTVSLDGNEVATAIRAYLVSRDIWWKGPTTITVNGELCESGRMYVDPSGFVMDNGTRYTGRGEIQP